MLYVIINNIAPRKENRKEKGKRKIFFSQYLKPL